MVPSLLDEHRKNEAISHLDKLIISNDLFLSESLDPKILKFLLDQNRMGFPLKNVVQKFALTNHL